MTLRILVSQIYEAIRAIVGARWKKSMRGFVARMREDEARKLAAHPEVALVEQDSVVYAHPLNVSSLHPNSIQTNAPWGLDSLDQKNRPFDGEYHYVATGAGVTAYVIDTGIRASHSEFIGRISPGYTAIVDGRGTDDCYGHGTHVAGILGGTTSGVAKEVTIVPVRVLDCNGSGTMSGVIAGVEWVTSQKKKREGPVVVNMSLSGNPSISLDTAIQNSIEAGVTFVVAAGNNSADACLYSPARVSGAITVGATNVHDFMESYSNFGTCVDILAPGGDIVSSSIKNDTEIETMSGTSMASPHVAGAAALYLSVNRGATPAQVNSALVAGATPQLIQAVVPGTPNVLLNTSFIAPDSRDTLAPVVVLTSPSVGSTIQGPVSLMAIAEDESGGSGMAKVEFYMDDSSLGTASTSPYQVDWNSAMVSNGSHTFYAKATDRAGNVATSAAITVIVANTFPPPLCSISSQLLLNPGMESGAGVGWVSSAKVITKGLSNLSRSGVWVAKFNGHGRKNTEALSQKVTIPANACSVSLTYWLRVFSKEATGASVKDRFMVSIESASGKRLENLATVSNRDRSSGFQQFQFNLSAYRGRTIKIKFKGVEGAGRATTFVVDDTALNVLQ